MNEQTNKILQQAQRLHEDQEYQQAAALYAELCDLEADNAKLQYLTGQEYFKAGLFQTV